MILNEEDCFLLDMNITLSNISFTERSIKHDPKSKRSSYHICIELRFL